MKTLSLICWALIGFLASQSALRADVLTLKDGKRVEGTFLKSDGKTVNFKTDLGDLTVDRTKISSITFGDAAPPAVPSATTGTATAPAATAAAGPVTLPAGTMLLVRTINPVSSATPAGTTYKTVLEYDLTFEGRVVAKAGTIIMGKVAASEQARRLRGKSMLDIRLETIELNGKSVGIATSGHQAATPASISKAAKGAAAGAAIGAIAGDAGKGAAIGAAAGGMKRGETISIAPGTLLEFTLTKPVTL